MGKIGISVVSGAALLAVTGAASAGPMSVATPQTVALKSQVEPVYYRYYHRHWRHYGWHRYRYYRHYGWYRHRYYRRYYGWNPAAAAAGAAVGLATVPFAAATGWPYYGYYGYPYYRYRYW
jgi:hypothetical protein